MVRTGVKLARGSQRASGLGVTDARLLLSHMRQLTHPGHQAGWGTCGDAPVTPTRQLSPPLQVRATSSEANTPARRLTVTLGEGEGRDAGQRLPAGQEAAGFSKTFSNTNPSGKCASFRNVHQIE